MARQFPDWIRRQWASGSGSDETRELLEELHLNTVCQSANCPNLGDCWGRRTATLLILGSVCARNCAYCAVKTGTPESVDPEEPARAAEAVRRLGLRHAVITSVTRDDLAGGGATHFAATTAAIHAVCPGTTVEVLVPDFLGNAGSVETVMEAEPEVFGHNVETVRRLYPEVRDGRAEYERSLEVLRVASGLSAGRTLVKSALMVGHGETEVDVRETLADLHGAGCEAVCIGQYLRPGKGRRDVVEYVTPSTFERYEALARSMGFRFAVSGPFVRSSYMSEEVLDEFLAAQGERHAQ